jgi:molybdopterin converting factor subunit 1
VRVEVRLFASAREAAGTGRTEVEVRAGATVAELFAELAAAHPALGAVLPSCRAAVDEEFAAATHPLHEGAVVAVLPPVSGG